MKKAEQQIKRKYRKYRKYMEARVLKRPLNYIMCDINQKYFFLQNNELVAAPQYNYSSGLFMSVLPNRNIPSHSEYKHPIFIGVSNKPLALCCVALQETLPQLQLTERKIIDLYSNNEESKNFTFFVKKSNNPVICSFESVAFPGWFLSTSLEPSQPLGLSRQADDGITMFLFKKKH